MVSAMITNHLHRWSVFASLLMLATGMSVCSNGNTAPLPNKGPNALIAPPQVLCIDERVSVKAKSVTLGQMLDGIAKACHLKIISPSVDKAHALVSADLADTALAEALNELLRGCNYLVVYNEPMEQAGFIATTAPLRSAQPAQPQMEEVAVADAENTPAADEKQEKIEYLRNQIDTLNSRIASGATDDFIEQAIQTKPREFVEDDRKILANYQERLVALEQQ